MDGIQNDLHNLDKKEICLLQDNKKQAMFVIIQNTKNPFNNEPDKMYLAWQEPTACDDDGYFWTRKDIFKEMQNEQSNGGFKFNTREHPFLFATKEEASALARKIKIGRYGRYNIDEWVD